MLLTRDQISQDRAYAQLTESILDRDQPKTTDIFLKLIRQEGRSIGDALSVLLAAEAPYVQVKCHINVRDGQIALTNNDHTILGLRTSTDLMAYLPEEYRLLALAQSVYYVPAGLDIWNQLLGKYPGRYAMMKGIDVPPPSYGPVVWNEDQAPLVEAGTLEERLHEHLIATMNGNVERSYRLFLGLAAEEQARPALRDQLLFLGIIDLQDTIIGRKARNTGHKALRARAVTDLAEVVGWERAHGAFYTGVPDMAVGPLYYSLYDAACVTTAEALPEAGKHLKAVNQQPLADGEIDGLVRLLVEGDRDAVWDRITDCLRSGVALRSLSYAVQLGAAETMLRTTDRKRFTDAQHAFDYANVVNHWLRTSDNPYQARAVYLMASFVNDVAHANKLYDPVFEQERAAYDFSNRTPERLLTELDEAILEFDVPRATVLADTYLRSGADRRAFLETVALTACKFQNDPHNQKITHSAFEEYEHAPTAHRDRLLLTAVRLLAGWPKMAGGRDCYERFVTDYRN